MKFERPDVLQAAARQARRAKRTSGRVVLTALGFGLAYYFDTANGPARRRQLREHVRTAVRKIDRAFTSDPVVDDVPAVFSPLLQSTPERPTIRPRPQSKTG
jgi:hypothetical protein